MIHDGKHIEVYDAYFNLPGGSKARVCEITGVPYAHVCHIDASGMGGRPSAHVIENLMALSPRIHEITEGDSKWKDFLKEQHIAFMETEIPYYQRVSLGDRGADFIGFCYKMLFKRRDFSQSPGEVENPDKWDIL